MLGSALTVLERIGDLLAYLPSWLLIAGAVILGGLATLYLIRRVWRAMLWSAFLGALLFAWWFLRDYYQG